MSVQAIDTLPASMRPLPKPRLEWRAAFRAVRKLLKDKEDTTQVFEIMRALNGTSIRDCYDQMLTTLSGGRQAFERKELAERLMDDAWLDQFAPGTLGAAYRHFIRSQHLSADGLAEVSRTTGGDIDVPHPHAWMGRRARDGPLRPRRPLDARAGRGPHERQTPVFVGLVGLCVDGVYA